MSYGSLTMPQSELKMLWVIDLTIACISLIVHTLKRSATLISRLKASCHYQVSQWQPLDIYNSSFTGNRWWKGLSHVALLPFADQKVIWVREIVAFCVGSCLHISINYNILHLYAAFCHVTKCPDNKLSFGSWRVTFPFATSESAHTDNFQNNCFQCSSEIVFSQ